MPPHAIVKEEEPGIPPMPSDAFVKHEHVLERADDDRPKKKSKAER